MGATQERAAGGFLSLLDGKLLFIIMSLATSTMFAAVMIA